jgi:hypothetical protein
VLFNHSFAVAHAEEAVPAAKESKFQVTTTHSLGFEIPSISCEKCIAKITEHLNSANIEGLDSFVLSLNTKTLSLALTTKLGKEAANALIIQALRDVKHIGVAVEKPTDAYMTSHMVAQGQKASKDDIEIFNRHTACQLCALSLQEPCLEQAWTFNLCVENARENPQPLGSGGDRRCLDDFKVMVRCKKDKATPEQFAQIFGPNFRM